MKLTKRDLAIMYDLYQYRTLTVDQIRRLYFAQTTLNYCYLRLHQLKKKGYMSSKPIVVEGQKNASCYLLTDYGIDELRDKGFVKETRLKAYDLKISGQQRAYTVSVNDLYIELSPFGWQMNDSRKVKETYSINRGNNVQGALINEAGDVYAFYMLSENPKDVTIAKVANELTQIPIDDVIVFCHDKAGFDAFREYVFKKSIVAGSIKLIPYHMGKHLLRNFQTQAHLFRKFSYMGEINPIKSTLGFKYTLHDGVEERFFVEMFTYDLMVLDDMRRYTKERYEQVQKKVTVVTFEEYMNELEDMFYHHPHIECKKVGSGELLSATSSKQLVL